MSMQLMYGLFGCKKKKGKFHWKIFDIFAQNIDCGYTLEPRRGGTNEYPQFMFLIKKNNKKNRFTPVNTSFAL